MVAVVVGLLAVGCGDEPPASAPGPRPLLVEVPAGALSAEPTEGARRTGIAFLRSYLALTYGRATPGGVMAADRHLRRDLERTVRRVPPAQRGRKPRIASLQLATQGARSAQITAVVDDGGLARYPIVVHLERQPHGLWLAVALGDD